MKTSFPISVVTWNVLADSYASSTFVGQRRKYAEIIRWSNRSKNIWEVLKTENADIVCLQEVDHYEGDFKLFLTDNGYNLVYYAREERPDGCLIAFKASKFDALKEERVDFDDLSKTEIASRSLNLRQRLGKHNIAVIVLLRSKCQKYLVDAAPSFTISVSSAHLYWNPSAPQVKFAQARYLLTRIANVRDENGLLPDASILNGDFNSKPQSQTYQCMLSGVPIPPNGYLTSSAAAEETASVVFQRRRDGVPVRFLCDVSLDRMARWLRMLGVNTTVSKVRSRNHERTRAQYEELFDIARQEQRVIVTQSTSLSLRVGCPEVFVLKSSETIKEGLVKLLNFYNVKLTKSDIMTKCAKCNGSIEPVELDDGRIKKHVPTDRPLWICAGCHQVYWTSDSQEGSSQRARALAEELFQLVEDGRKKEYGDKKLPNEARNAANNPNICVSNGTAQKSASMKQRDKKSGKLCEVRRIAQSEWLRFKSAFPAALGVEPYYTNINGAFRGTLDYIFVGGNCRVENVRIRTRVEESSDVMKGYFPNLEWPSDHMLLRAEVLIKKLHTSSGRSSFPRSSSLPSRMSDPS